MQAVGLAYIFFFLTIQWLRTIIRIVAESQNTSTERYRPHTYTRHPESMKILTHSSVSLGKNSEILNKYTG